MDLTINSLSSKDHRSIRRIYLRLFLITTKIKLNIYIQHGLGLFNSFCPHYELNMSPKLPYLHNHKAFIVYFTNNEKS